MRHSDHDAVVSAALAQALGALLPGDAQVALAWSDPGLGEGCQADPAPAQDPAALLEALLGGATGAETALRRWQDHGSELAVQALTADGDVPDQAWWDIARQALQDAV